MGIFFAGGTLITAILGQYILFEHRMQEIVRSVEIQRTLSRNPVRKGTKLQVVSSISFRGLPRMQVLVSDLLPSGTILAEGETTIATRPDHSLPAHQCSYQIIPLTHGSHPFSGVSVTVRNLFFEDSLCLARESDRQPVLTVLPTGLFAAPVSELSEGTRDNRKKSVRSGLDIHSLREYCPGDDLRHVDWKISAKYDKLFIRKYTALMNHPPLIIIDLPWCGAPYPEKEFNRMVSEAAGMVKQTIEKYQQVSVLIISGPNILHLIREEKNISRCMSELLEWMHPAERPVHFYHMPDRSDLRSHVRDSEKALRLAEDSPVKEFYELLRNRYLSILQYQRSPLFSGQVARTLSQLLMTEAYIFSLGCGDNSHIRHVERPLRSQNIRVQVRIMDSTRPGKSGLRDYPENNLRGHA
ncbi:MAG: hypothetical protein CVV30_04335 [Methanomicrobiales archaeon HGW-Methanomicrobiales-1]|jgi:uncharacterized protein (DUF58 family)|nr:MAG: hypothetical protein CVV30_04335 [Methanomicrobiales archaeon HGW-Methanomicrobiales-1]